MPSRIWSRLWVLARAMPRLVVPGRSRPTAIHRILIAHHLLLGDTIMLAPLLKRLRHRYPDANITMLCNPAYVSLFEKKPYGVTALPYDPRSLAAHRRLGHQAAFDFALIPGDNRWSWLARALRSHWIVAFASDKRSYKDWPIDEFVSFPSTAETWGDIAVRLCDDSRPDSYAIGEWQQPSHSPFEEPQTPYCVFHLGASSPHKLWPSDSWLKLISWVESLALGVILTSGRGEEKLLTAVDPKKRHRHYAGTLDLPQIWQLLRKAKFLVCPDTGIAHLARIVGTPTVALFGPGSPDVSGQGRFWKESPFVAVTIKEITCRDQDLLFERKLEWVRHCWRTPAECGSPVCIQAITFDHARRALAQLGVAPLAS
jgi:ADP-heptose:LPS heptosyltransferase